MIRFTSDVLCFALVTLQFWGTLILSLTAAVVVGATVWTMYNRLIRSRQRMLEAWSGIDVQLKRRTSLIPNLVESVRGYATHEHGVFEDVARARSMLDKASGVQDSSSANTALSQALGRRGYQPLCSSHLSLCGLRCNVAHGFCSLGRHGHPWSRGAGAVYVQVVDGGAGGPGRTAGGRLSRLRLIAQAAAADGTRSPGRPEPGARMRRTVENLSIGAGLAAPRLYVVESPAPNAFAVGLDPEHASIVVTRGLLRLPVTVLRWLWTFAKYTVNRSTAKIQTAIGLAAYAVMGAPMILSLAIFLPAMFWNDFGFLGPAMLLLPLHVFVLAPLLSPRVCSAISRDREYLADALWGRGCGLHQPSGLNKLFRPAPDRLFVARAHACRLDTHVEAVLQRLPSVESILDAAATSARTRVTHLY